jgi:hypothetical protein
MKINLPLPRFEHIYVMFDPLRYPLRAKVGISISAKERRNQVEQSIRSSGRKVALKCPIYLPVLYARKCEAFIHRILRPLSFDGLHGTSGGSEWFYFVNVASFLLLWITFYLFGHDAPMYKAGIFLFVPVPLDFYLLILAIAALQYAAIIGGLWFGFWMVGLY